MEKVQIALFIFGIFVVGYTIMEWITGTYSHKQSFIFLIESLAGVVLIFLPQLIRQFLRFEIPGMILLFYWFFLFISVFLGTGLHLISLVPFWDKILHAISPMVLTALGYGLIGYFMRKPTIEQSNHWLFLIFGFSFALACGIFWEFWEFFCDQFFAMNLQRYSSGGTLLVGRAALMDTMGDLFTNTFGALVMGTFAWFQSRKNSEYFVGYRIEKMSK